MPTLPWEIAAKAVLYAAVLAATGACAIDSLLLPLLAGPPDTEVGMVARALRPVRTGAAAAVLGALALRVLTHTAAAFGWPDTLSWDALQTIAIDSRWGAAWRLQVAAASLFLLASVWAGRARRGFSARGSLAAIACLAVCYSMPLLGHGAGSWWRVLLHGTHILGAGVWVGMLIALLLIRVPRQQRLTLLRGLTPLALAGAAVLGIAGVVMAWSYIGAASNLWTTTYGGLLSLKLVLFCSLAICGWVNWRRFAGERRGAALNEHLWVVTIEIVIASILIAVTAGLTEVAHP